MRSRSCKSTPLSRRSCGRRGFSLIEICVVLGILAILFGIGFMNFSRAKANREVDGAAMEMSNALKYARSAAISSNGVTVTFLTAGAQPSSYTITTSGGQVLKRLVLPTDVTLTVPNSMTPLTFGANGSASAAGTIVLTSLRTGRSGRIDVQQVAGTVTLSMQ